MDPKKIANNILEFMYDPTVIPVETRLYFRPEERLQNQAYEKAKADAKAAFGNQSKNSDFYPSRKTTPEREASMDRKTLIASLDVLSQNFDENDPIGKDLRTMAYAIANMNDEEFGTRMAKGKAETVPCPTCGTKVLKATGYCLKCKKKIGDMKEAAAEACTVCGKEPCACEGKEAEVKDFWTKEASDAVSMAIVADHIEAKEEMWAEEKKEEVPEEKEPAKEKEKDAAKEEPAKEEEKAAPAPEEKAEDVEEKEAKSQNASNPKYPDGPAPKVPQKDAQVEPQAVDTSILAYDGIEIGASMEDVPTLTDSEKAQLDNLFN